ncbi:hypothetical protein NESM_000447600 [Novymonas esmeraldas]|uniref:Transmembrane protein n=1 Tax=Novymonas esmeraldas TaxID=1808958 RepID=A0AAW0ENA4_9TRYP
MQPIAAAPAAGAVRRGAARSSPPALLFTSPTHPSAAAPTLADAHSSDAAPTPAHTSHTQPLARHRDSSSSSSSSDDDGSSNRTDSDAAESDDVVDELDLYCGTTPLYLHANTTATQLAGADESAPPTQASAVATGASVQSQWAEHGSATASASATSHVPHQRGAAERPASAEDGDSSTTDAAADASSTARSPPSTRLPTSAPHDTVSDEDGADAVMAMGRQVVAERCDGDGAERHDSTRASPPPPPQPPVMDAESSGPQMPPLMAELDGELLQLIKAYYQRKHAGAVTATTSVATTTAASPPPPPPSVWAAAHAPAIYTGPALGRMNSARSSGGSVTGGGGSRLMSHAATPPAAAAAPAVATAASVLDRGGDGGSGGDHGPLPRAPYLAGPQSWEESAHVYSHGSRQRVAGLSYSSAAPPHTTPTTMWSGHGGALHRHSTTTTTAAAAADDIAGAAPHDRHHLQARSGGGGGSGIASGGFTVLSSLPSYSSTSFVRAYVTDVGLSLEPAVLVSALTAALNIVVVYFLQQHVLDTRDHLGLFLIGSYMIFSSYYMVYHFLERFSGSFRRIASQDKKFYIIGNLIKAGILISITPFACVHLVKIIVLEEWESNILRNLGCIYAIPDFISMVVVRRMRWSTWVHHACVVLFNYVSIMNNYKDENVCRCVVVYAAFSSFAYCVNLLLASRFLGVSADVARVLSFIALVVYALCCAVNWAWQVYYLRRLLTNGNDHWTVYVYMALISLVMWDDVVLNRWLLQHARHNACAASQHMQQHRLRQQQQQQQQSGSTSPAAGLRLSPHTHPLRGTGHDARLMYPPSAPLPPPGRSPT